MTNPTFMQMPREYALNVLGVPPMNLERNQTYDLNKIPCLPPPRSLPGGDE